MTAFYTVLGIALAITLLYFVIYNSLIGKKNRSENAFAAIDATLQKRYDLIPNLVATVQHYMQHEKSTFAEVTKMRATAMAGGLSTDEKVALDNQISKAIDGIMIAVENYPDLKSNENFNQLQRTMVEVEEQLSASRRSFNAAITDYNDAIEMLPTNIVANIMGYKRKNLFSTTDKARENVDVPSLFNT